MNGQISLRNKGFDVHIVSSAKEQNAYPKDIVHAINMERNFYKTRFNIII